MDEDDIQSAFLTTSLEVHLWAGRSYKIHPFRCTCCPVLPSPASLLANWARPFQVRDLVLDGNYSRRTYTPGSTMPDETYALIPLPALRRLKVRHSGCTPDTACRLIDTATTLTELWLGQVPWSFRDAPPKTVLKLGIAKPKQVSQVLGAARRELLPRLTCAVFVGLRRDDYTWRQKVHGEQLAASRETLARCLRERGEVLLFKA